MAQFDNIVKLADCCSIWQGKNIDKKKTNDDGRGYPVVVGASDIVNGAFLPKRWCDAPISNPVYTEQGDILLSVVGTIGKMGVNTVGRALLSKHVCAIRLHEGVSRLYIMAMISRLILDTIPDTDDDVVLGFQNKADVDALAKVRFTLPSLIMQEWIVSRLASIASMIFAYKGHADDYLSYEKIISMIELERKEQRAHVRKLAENLKKLASMLDNLPPDSDTIEMIKDATGAYNRLLKIQ